MTSRNKPWRNHSYYMKLLTKILNNSSLQQAIGADCLVGLLSLQEILDFVNALLAMTKKLDIMSKLWVYYLRKDKPVSSYYYIIAQMF
jgi:hypothetical protein